MTTFKPMFTATEAVESLTDVKAQREAAKPGGTIPSVGQGSATASATKKRITDLSSLRKYAKEQIEKGSDYVNV